MKGSEQPSILLDPNLPAGSAARRIYMDTVKSLLATANKNDVGRIRTAAFRAADRCESHSQVVRVCVSVLCDLRLQGWTFRLTPSQVQGLPAVSILDSPNLEKQRIREAHLFERDAQLQIPTIRDFVRRMERQHLGPNGWVSIFSLMREGEELAAQLRNGAESQKNVKNLDLLSRCIDPYIQVVDPYAKCAFTGLRLIDIWRYFRHTWVTPYSSIPGRQMWILIRDRAAPNHPVMGIAALGSAVVQLTPRDAWIGWTSKAFLKTITDKPTTGWAKWLSLSLRDLIRGIYIKDFLDEHILTTKDLTSPTSKVVARLSREAERARRWHVKFPRSRHHKSGAGNWEVKAKMHLFRAKRARLLAALLNGKQKLLETGFRRASARSLSRALQTSSGRSAIEVILNHAKATHVGIDMLDITVCGAIPPYNALLGGKLVAMLLASPEISLAYEKKYGTSQSIIASSMAGKPVVRKPRLCLLGTTSLYGVSSSQYNRIRIPIRELGLKGDGQLSYELLGRTLGYGSYHLSAVTVAEMDILLARSHNGRKVNSIFGEGVSPRLRKLRDGLAEVGLPSDVLLVHGNPRLIYGISLARNFREILLHRAKRPTYLFPRSNPVQTSQAIARFWMKRWLSKRIERSDVLDQVSAHSVKHPLQHGARVPLPPVEEERALLAVAR